MTGTRRTLVVIVLGLIALFATACSSGGSNKKADEPNPFDKARATTSTTKPKASGKSKTTVAPKTTPSTQKTSRGVTPKTLPKTAPKSPPKTLPDVTTPQEGAAAHAYAQAYEAECRSLWSHAGSDGLLWDPENLDSGSYDVNDCLSGNDKDLGAAYGSVADASAQGKSDADLSASDFTVSGRLSRTGGGGAFDVPQ